MSSRKNSYLTFDWWVIEKKQIYLLLLCILAMGGLVALVVYISRHGLPFTESLTGSNSKGGARFVFFEGDVRVLRAATRESVPVTSELEVFAGDTLQTQGNGRARLTMADGSTLWVRENSTVLIRDNAGEAGQNANVKVTIDRGQINVRTEDGAAHGRNIVETPRTASAVAAQTNTSFRVNADQSEEIRVNNGQLQTTTRDGQKTTINAGEYVAVTPAGTLARRESLLAAPKLLAPDDATQLVFTAAGAPSVTLRWARSTGAAHYRVEIASSPFFVKPSISFERDQMTETALLAPHLTAGTYFWRVRANGTNQNSEWSEAFKFSLMPPAQANRAVLGELHAALVGGRIYLITGRARPGTTVRCLGRETLATREQTWQLQVTAPAGTRTLSVTGQEAQGPVSSYQVALP